MDSKPTDWAMRRARVYFALQAVCGLIWWIAVFASNDVHRLTLGSWNAAAIAVPDLLLFVGASALGAATAAWGWAALTAAWTIGITAALCLYALLTREAGWGALLMFVASAFTITAAMALRSGRVPTAWFFVGPFSFRPAPPRTRRSHLAHSLVQLVLFWTAFLVLLPLALAWAEHRLRLDAPVLYNRVAVMTGIVVFIAGSAAGLWACVAMALIGEGTPLPAATGRRLVVAGPYRHVRNPMAVAGAVQTIGAGLYLGSWLVVLSAVIGGIVWNVFIRPEEEADLARRFGAPYERYRETVACWVPRARPKTAGHAGVTPQ